MPVTTWAAIRVGVNTLWDGHHAYQRKRCRTQRHRQVGAEAGGLTLHLPFHADDRTETSRRQKAQGEVEVAGTSVTYPADPLPCWSSHSSNERVPTAEPVRLFEARPLPKQDWSFKERAWRR